MVTKPIKICESKNAPKIQKFEILRTIKYTTHPAAMDDKRIKFEVDFLHREVDSIRSTHEHTGGEMDWHDETCITPFNFIEPDIKIIFTQNKCTLGVKWYGLPW